MLIFTIKSIQHCPLVSQKTFQGICPANTQEGGSPAKSIYYVFIHIPKNCGRFIRKKYSTSRNYTVIKSYWRCQFGLDLAHIPYMFRDKFLEKNVEYNYFAYTRNPYDRIISAFLYRNSKQKNKFKDFVKNQLIVYDFTMDFKEDIIHYYPQYLFVCDENMNVQENIQINKTECMEECIKTLTKYNLDEFFDDECFEIVNKIYYKDFSLFDYKLVVSLDGVNSKY